ncbi:MAG TPA: cation:dicarboxylase symporter family transporter [Caulobacterales bacterium]|nr:cation:dicarboxylase symporter family transporter [Caulobacterales bacterium]
MFRSLSFYVLLGLVLGLAAGVAIQRYGGSEWQAVAQGFAPIGGLWLNALRMTVVPLVFALLVTGVASVTDAASTGKLTARAMVLFSVLLVFGALYSFAFTGALLHWWPVDRADAAKIMEGIDASAASIPPPDFGAWVKALAPANPIAAAASDAVLPLSVFALFFGFAVTRLAPPLRDLLVNLFRAVSEAMVVIIHWVLLAGPIGVFSLALGVGASAGLAAAGTLAHYIAIAVIVGLGVTLIAFVLAVTWGALPIGRFVAAATPVWAIAFSTQSSLASLPAMLEASRQLKISERIADLILPLAVAIFRFTSPVINLVVVLFVAHVHGVVLAPQAYLAGILASYAASIAAVGLPGQVSFITSIAPICLAMGVPIDLLGVLLAVEVIPDIFRTLGNVTGDLAATAILSRKERAL